MQAQIDTLASFLAGLTPSAQIDWLRRQPERILQGIDKHFGMGAADCDCPVNWLPCAEHDLTRFQLIARIAHRDNTPLSRLAKLSNRKLFGILFPVYAGQERCDCPAVCEPCIHSVALFHTPLDASAIAELRKLLDRGEHAEPPEPLGPTFCGTTKTKAIVMEERRDEGFGLRHPQDFLRRRCVPDDAIQRVAHTLRNGALAPGDVTLKGHAA